MQGGDRFEKPVRCSRFEAFEDRLALSADPVVDSVFEIGERLESTFAEITAALADAHEMTGVKHVRDTYGFEGAGQTVAIIDSGIAYDHEALGRGFGAGHRVVGGWDFAENDADPYDDAPAGFHGTHVAGIVGSDNETYRGVASKADLVALRVFDDQGRGSMSWVENALKWVHDHRQSFTNPITTVNLSLGTSWNSNVPPSWAQLEDEFAQLERDGIFIAVAAGNSFASYNSPGLSYPAASPYVVPVASVDNDGMLSSFSQRSSSVLAAPGRLITSTVPDYIYGGDGVANDFGEASGTSMASPYVAGASVLVREAMQASGYTNITQDMIYDHLRNTADVIHDTATNADYFRIDVAAAIDSLVSGGNRSDDYGSGIDTAYALGTVSGVASVSGRIERAGDSDYFSFVAGSTGQVRLTLQASGLTPTVQFAGVQASSQQGLTTLNAVAGQRYVFSVGSQAGTGSYDIGISIMSTPRDLGQVDFVKLDGQQFLGGETWFQFTATRTGLFTADAAFSGSSGEVSAQLYSANQQLLAGSSQRLGLQRLDATVVAGGRYLLKISGPNSDVDLRLTNLVALQDGNLSAYGTSGADSFVYSARDVTLTVNGVSYGPWDTTTFQSVTLNGAGGSDVFQYVGGAANERVTFRSSGVSVSGAGYTLRATGMEDIQASGGGGQDSALMYDTAGDDHFVTNAEEATLSGAGYRFEAQGFETVYAYATAGGVDSAELYDTAGNDTFRADPASASLMTSAGVYTARGFDRVTAYALAGGDDTARLYDSTGQDLFVGNATSAQLSGSGFANTAQRFEHVFAYASRGGYDTARLDDSAGDDTFFADSFTSTMSGSGFANSVQQFDRVSAFAMAGGYDVARLYDSSGSDTLSGDGAGVTLSGSGYQNDAYRFERVYANSARGGRDVANLQDGARAYTVLSGNFVAPTATAGNSLTTAASTARFFQRGSTVSARQYVMSELESSHAAAPASGSRDFLHYLSNRNHASTATLAQVRRNALETGAEESHVDCVFESMGA